MKALVCVYEGMGVKGADTELHAAASAQVWRGNGRGGTQRRPRIQEETRGRDV